MLFNLGKCKRCGGTVVNDDPLSLSLEKIESARCLNCGEIYYKDYPKTLGPRKSRKTRITKCIICGRPIFKGLICNKKKCRETKNW